MACTMQYAASQTQIEELSSPELNAPTRDPNLDSGLFNTPVGFSGHLVVPPTIQQTRVAESVEDPDTNAQSHCTSLSALLPEDVDASVDDQHLHKVQSRTAKTKQENVPRNVLSWLSWPNLQQSFNPIWTNSSKYTLASITSRSSTATISSADGTSLHTLPSTTTPPSLASSMTSVTTSLETRSVFLYLNSPHIYLWNTEQNVFMGRLMGCPPSECMTTEWQDVVRIRLMGDLWAVLQSLPHSLPRERTVIEAELVMMGQSTRLSDQVEMIPTVLIRCGGKRCQKAVANAVDDLEYLKNFSRGRIVVHRQPPRFASNQGNDAGPSTRSIHSPEGSTIVEVGVLSNLSACGLRIKTKHLGLDRFCTLGGLIQVNGKVYGLTTAHALVSSSDESSSCIASSSDSDSDSSLSDSTTSSSNRMDKSNLQTRSTGTDRFNPMSGAEKWVPANLGPYSYLTKRQPLGTNNAYSVSDASDFALIEIADELSEMPNSYLIPDHGRSNTQTIKKLGSLLSEKSEQRVSIIRAFSDVRQGHVLSGDQFIIDKGATFNTKKIELEYALERGSSGAWVVQGSSLLGIIIAVYDNEPYAHMLDITNVFQDIRALLSDGEQIPSVLVGGPVKSNTNNLASDLAKRSITSPLKIEPYDNPLLYHHTASREQQMSADALSRPLLMSTNDDWVTWPTSDLEKPSYGGEQVGSIDPKDRTLLLFGLIFASACVYLDSFTITFQIPKITDSLNSVRHVGLYVGFYRIMAGVVRPYLEVLSQRSPRIVLFLSLLVLQAGWMFCGFASHSWLFVAGRAFLGAGSAGVITSSKVLERLLTDKRVHRSGSAYSLILIATELASCLVGPFIGSAFADHLTWRWYMCFNAGIGIVATLLVIFTRKSILLTSPQAEEMATLSSLPETPQVRLSFMVTTLSLSFIVGIGHISSYGWRSAAVIVPITISSLSLLAIPLHAYVRRRWTTSLQTDLSFGNLGPFAFYAILCRIAPAIVAIYLPFWFQTIKDMSASSSALTMLALNIPVLGCAILMRCRPLQSAHSPLLTLAICLVAVGAGLMASLTPLSNMWKWMVIQVFFGIGAGLVFPHPALLNSLHFRQDGKPLSYHFHLCYEPVMSINIALAHFLFMQMFGMELRRSSVEDVNGILSSGASNWMSTAALSSTANSPNTVASQGLIHRNILSQALRSTFMYAAIISGLAIVPSILRWIVAFFWFWITVHRTNL